MEDIVTCPYCGSGSVMRFVASHATTAMKGYFHCDTCNARSPRVRHEYVDDFPGRGTVPPTRAQSCLTYDLVEALAREACGIFALPDLSDVSVNDEDFAEVLN